MRGLSADVECSDDDPRDWLRSLSTLMRVETEWRRRASETKSVQKATGETHLRVIALASVQGA